MADGTSVGSRTHAGVSLERASDGPASEASIAIAPWPPQPAGGAAPDTPARQDRLARAILRELSAALPTPLEVVLRPDLGPQPAPPISGARVVIRDAAALGRILWPPTPEAFAEAYLRGDLEIEGDLGGVIRPAQGLDLRRLGVDRSRRIARWAFELRRSAGTQSPPLLRAARLRGHEHTRARDLEAVRFHYDVGNDFYRLWLDRRLVYSCAWFASAQDTIDDAQEAKLELICRKLALEPGQRLLDIGCGWGSLIGYAAERHGVAAVGVTLSERQAAVANATADQHGWTARAQVRDYRDLAALGSFDAVASVGMFEHVGRVNLGEYFRAAFAATRPGGLFLNHGIASASPAQAGSRGGFVDRYVFPDGELVPIDEALREARAAGFEIVDAESLRPHYALTLAAWVRRLEARWEEAVAAAGDEVARTWRLYMTAARLGFEDGSLDVFQALLARPVGTGPAPRPRRPWWR